MKRASELLSWLTIDKTQPAIALAQMAELQRQIPLLYALLMVNAVAVAYTHYGVAPDSLTIGVLCPLLAVCFVRLVAWLRKRAAVASPEAAVAQLRRTIVLAGLISVAYISWSLSLDAYGGPFERGHVALFIAITVIGCIFCLMHLPQAALLVTVVVTVPYLFHYLLTENPVFIAIAVNIFLVTLVMVQVLLNSYHGFTTLIRSQGETKRLSDENARLAHTDALTGLPNRRFFFARLASQIETSRQEGGRFAVGVLDLDRFKPINDTHGHIFGDRLLAEVGARLRDAGRPGTIVARLGGDEFGFITVADGDDARVIGQSLCDLVAEAYQFEDNRISIGCSCGLAVYPEAGDTVHELFDRSDYALYNSKTSRRGSATLYSAEHETRIRSERAIESALQSSDLDSEMSLHLQPIIDTTRGTVVAVEALARWESPTLGRVPPDAFIAVAEKAGLIHSLTLTLFRKAMVELARLPAEIGLSFNLSAQDVTSPQTVLALVSIVRQAGVDPGRIIIEVTETSVMRNFDVAADSIRLLRSLGVRIAIDDFGTGYSSLGYLHRMAVDKLKIDRSFISELGTAPGRNIVASIIGLCRNLEIECIAEGVEEVGQFAVLDDLGCSLVQGYLYARPMPTEDFLDWYAERSSPPSRSRLTAV